VSDYRRYHARRPVGKIVQDGTAALPGRIGRGSTGESDYSVEVADACRRIWPQGMPPAPAGYPDSLAWCIIDSVWSMGVRYSAVENVLRRYECWLVDERRGARKGRTSVDLRADISFAGGPDGFAGIVKNRMRTATRNGFLKAEAVDHAAARLDELGIATAADLRHVVRRGSAEALERLERGWRSVPGQASGISFKYLLMLAGIEDVKPDRMICRFVASAAGLDAVKPDVAYRSILGAHQIFLAEGERLTLRALDHAIWSYQRQR